jgi:hypothetical protein
MDDVEINVEDDWDLGLLTDGGDCFEQLRRRSAGFKTALGGELIHQTVCKRIAEGNAEFQHVHACFIEFQSQLACGFEIWISCPDIDNESFFVIALQFGEAFHDAIHCGRLSG